MNADPMNFGDWVGAVLSIVQIVAIVVAAGWAYSKFVRGRTFARRLEPSIEGELLRAGDAEAIRARVALRNTGASDIPLHAKAIRVYAVGDEGWGDEKVPTWTRLMTVPVLAQHQSLESVEVVSEQVLIPLKPETFRRLAYRLEFVVQDELRRRRFPRRKKGGRGWSWKHGHRWISEAVVLREFRPVLDNDSSHSDPGSEEASHGRRPDDRPDR